MTSRWACASLVLLALTAAAGCATPENTGIPQPTPAPEGDAASRAEAEKSGGAAAGGNASGGDDGSAAAAAPTGDVGADGEPVQETITGADPKLEGAPDAWKSGQSATAVRPATGSITAEHVAGLAAPKRDGLAHQYELRAFGTEVEVYMDGQPVPVEQIVVHGNTVGVLNEQGEVIERLDLPEHWAEDSQAAATPNTQDPYDFRDVKGAKLTPPKVMLGGRLVEPSPAVLKHLADRGVKRDRVSMVTNVMPGLPLAAAGVENDDIVLAVNEVPDADPGTVRAVLRTLNPGDAVTLRLLRGTQILDARVVLMSWDPKFMVRPVGTGGHTPVAGDPVAGAGAEGPKTPAQMEEELARAKLKIADLERQLNSKDPVRRAIRPAAVPAPTGTAKPAGTPAPGGK